MSALRALAVAWAVTLAATATGCVESRVEPVNGKSCTTAATPTLEEANKALVERLRVEMWDKRNPDAALSGMVAANLVNHAAIPEAQGAEGLRTIHRKLLAAYPDVTFKPLDVVAEGDRVVVRALMEATQTGTLEFKEPIPATNKHVRIEMVHAYRIKDGKIVEMWMTMDRLDLMRQLGLAPHPKNRS
jgi:predicted ester cyclase